MVKWHIRAVVSGGAGGALTPPEFGNSVYPISTRGGRLCPPHYCKHPRIRKPNDISAYSVLLRPLDQPKSQVAFRMLEMTIQYARSVEEKPKQGHSYWTRLSFMNHSFHPRTTDARREEKAFTARPKIHSYSQSFRYGQSIFCLPLRPNFSDIFDLCLHWVSVVRGSNQTRTSSQC